MCYVAACFPHSQHSDAVQTIATTHSASLWSLFSLLSKHVSGGLIIPFPSLSMPQSLSHAFTCLSLLSVLKMKAWSETQCGRLENKQPKGKGKMKGHHETVHIPHVLVLSCVCTDLWLNWSGSIRSHVVVLLWTQHLCRTQSRLDPNKAPQLAFVLTLVMPTNQMGCMKETIMGWFKLWLSFSSMTKLHN